MTFEIQMNGTTLCTNTDMNGIIDPQVQKEVNTAGSLSFTVLPTCTRWNEFKRMRCYLDVLVNGYNIFRGRVMSISDDIYNQRTIECEGALAFLMDTIIDKLDMTYDGYDNHDSPLIRRPEGHIDYWFRHYHNPIVELGIPVGNIDDVEAWDWFDVDIVKDTFKTFRVGTVHFDKFGITKDTEDEWKNDVQPLGDFLTDICTKKNYGMIRARTLDVNYFDWIAGDNPIRTTARFVFGENIIEVTNTTSDVEPYSILVPVTDDAAHGVLPWPFPVLGHYPYAFEVNRKAQQMFGNVVKTVDVNTTDVDKALERCMKIFNLQNPTYPSSITIKALDNLLMAGSAPIDICESALVTIPHQNLNNTEMTCLSFSLDLCHPENNEYTLGTYVSDNEDYKIDTLTKSFAKSKKKKKK